MIAMQQPSVVVYAMSRRSCSVCVPICMPNADVERVVNRLKPTSDGSVWRVSRAEVFATGQPHPCPCPQKPGFEHRLMEC